MSQNFPEDFCESETRKNENNWVETLTGSAQRPAIVARDRPVVSITSEKLKVKSVMEWIQHFKRTCKTKWETQIIEWQCPKLPHAD